MNKLNIIEVVIEDSLGQLAKTCTLTLAPDSPENPPVAEFGYPGDELKTGSTSLRPNGAYIDIVGTYGGVASHVLFRGAIEYMDDLEDPDQMSYKITLSQMPKSFPHKKKFCALWNMNADGEDLGWEFLTSTSILEAMCDKAGLFLGRNDLPNYNIWGTYEVVHQSPVEVAQSLVAPFNQVDYEKYYVRADMNGLQIIKVNYANGPDVSNGVNVYSIGNMTSRQSSYQLYVPDRSTEGDILLSGGDKYFNTATGQGRWEVNAVHRYEESSLANGFAISTGDQPIEERHTEKITEVKFKVELTYNKEDYSPNGQPLFEFPEPPDDGVDIDVIVGMVKAGTYTTATILESQAWHIIDRNYGPIHGQKTLLREQETYVTFEEISFTGDGSIDTSMMDTTRVVPTFDVTTVSALAGEGLVPATMTRNWYHYDNVGNPSYTVTATYAYCRGWHLLKVEVQRGETLGVTNALLQFYLNGWNSQSNAPEQQPLKGTRISRGKTPMAKYQLLNGSIISPLFIPQRNGAPKVDAEYIWAMQRSRAALQISCPGMDYGGLGLVWNQVKKGLDYQTGGYYWHSVSGTHSLDTSPVVGESIRVGGVSGICESYRHTINADEAITQVSIRKLVKK